MGAKPIKAPINMHRKVTEKYYFLLPPNATRYLFGCKTEDAVSEDEHCLSVSEWDAEKAVPVTPARKPPDICISEVYEDEYQNLYDSRTNEITLRVPKYRPGIIGSNNLSVWCCLWLLIFRPLSFRPYLLCPMSSAPRNNCSHRLISANLRLN